MRFFLFWPDKDTCYASVVNMQKHHRNSTSRTKQADINLLCVRLLSCRFPENCLWWWYIQIKIGKIFCSTTCCRWFKICRNYKDTKCLKGLSILQHQNRCCIVSLENITIFHQSHKMEDISLHNHSESNILTNTTNSKKIYKNQSIDCFFNRHYMVLFLLLMSMLLFSCFTLSYCRHV